MKKYLVTFCFFLFHSILAVAQNPQQVEDWYTNAVKLYEQQETAQAMAAFEKVIQLNPRHINALFNLAVIYYDLGHKDQAIQPLCGEFAAAASPHFRKANLRLALLED